MIDLTVQILAFEEVATTTFRISGQTHAVVERRSWKTRRSKLYARLARAVALGIALPLGLRRRMQLVSIRDASHSSLAFEQKAVSAQTDAAVLSRSIGPSLPRCCAAAAQPPA